MNSTVSPHKTLSTPLDYDLDGGSIPGDVLPANLYPELDRFAGLPCPRCRELMHVLPTHRPRIVQLPNGVAAVRTYATDNNPHAPTLDHVVPKARGGAFAFDNERVICRRCNSSKGTRAGPRPLKWGSCPACGHPASWHYPMDGGDLLVCQVESAQKGREWFCFP